jgi:hypothetical protein
MKRRLLTRRANSERYWFTRVSYGFGWTPANTKGWTTIILHIALIFLWATLILRGHFDDELHFIEFITIFFVQTGVLFWIAHVTGERAEKE